MGGCFLAGFVSELKRRNVMRVAAAYAVVAWVAIQVASEVFPALGVPDWAMTGLVVLAALGFPVTLLISWFYELTPEGLMTTEAADEAGLAKPPAFGRQIDFVIIALLVVAVGWLIWRQDSIVSDNIQLGNASIAVLPFVSMSSGEDDGFFADGLTEELLNALAQVSELKVAARTSSFYYKGKNQDLREIGRALGVAHILEGSVRRAGEQLRITAQLIETEGGTHLWSETYDRTLDDIFAIQEDIANEVTAALRVTILGEEAEAMTRHGTTSAEAQRKYLTASAHLRMGATLWVDLTQNNEHLEAARRLLEEAVLLDPDFAEAWAKLVSAYYLLSASGLSEASSEMLTRPEAFALAGPAAARAVALAPNLPESWVAMALHKEQSISGDLINPEEAEAAYEKALALDPDNLPALEAYAAHNTRRGLHSKASELYDRAAALDPLSRVRLLRAQSMYRVGRINEARGEYLEIARLFPDAPYEGGIAEIEFEKGHFDHGLLWQSNLAGSLHAPYVWLSLGDLERALAAWAPYKSGGGTLANFAVLGDYFFKRDYRGLYDTVISLNDDFWDVNFLMPSLYYLRKWEEAVSTIENWPIDHVFLPQHPARITGTEGVKDTEFGGKGTGSTATRAVYYAHALASIGRRQDAEAGWQWALKLSERMARDTPRQRQERHHLRLLIFASRGEPEAALAEFEAMADAGWHWLVSPGNMDRTIYSVGLGWFEDSPLLDSIRDEPRFIAVLEQVKADNAAMLAELNAGLTLEDIMDEE